MPFNIINDQTVDIGFDVKLVNIKNINYHGTAHEYFPVLNYTSVLVSLLLTLNIFHTFF